MDELLSTKEAAVILNTDINFMGKLIDAGLLPYLQMRARKIRRKALDTFMEKYEGWDISDPYNPIKLDNVK